MRSRKALVISAKTLYLGIGLIIIGLITFISWPWATKTSVPITEIVSGKIVYIDPGHGGRDPGCVSAQGLTEKELVLDIAYRLDSLFRSCAIDARLTRTEDKEVLPEDWAGGSRWKRPELENRLRQANEGKGDIFLSIHANSFPEPVWSGAQTFYYPDRVEDKLLAISIQNMLVTKLGPNRRKAKAGEFYVLAGAKMPAVMIEVGFLSNPREAGLLATEEYRQKVSEAIFAGVVQYLVETRTKGRPPLTGSEEIETAKLSALLRKDHEVVLYFLGPTNQDDCLAPEIRAIPQLQEVAMVAPAELVELALQQLVIGPGPGSILHPLLPRETTIQKVEVEPNGKVTVSLGPEVERAFRGGGHSEELVVYGVVNTVTELIPNCEVFLCLDGKVESSIGGHVWLNRPLRARQDLVCPK